VAEAFLAWYKAVEEIEAQFEVWPSKRFPIMDEITLAWWGYVPFPYPTCFNHRAMPYLAASGELLTSLQQSIY
jgi:hypothetical protein